MNDLKPHAPDVDEHQLRPDDPMEQALSALKERWPDADFLLDGDQIDFAIGDARPTIELVWGPEDEEDPAVCWGPVDRNGGVVGDMTAVDAMTEAIKAEMRRLNDDARELWEMLYPLLNITVLPRAKPPALPAPQPAPAGGQGDVWQEVIDVEHFRFDSDPRLIQRWEERRRVGIERYGVPLGRYDGRDPVRDLLEELDDAIAYAARLDWSDIADDLRLVLIRALDRVGAR